MKKHDEKKHKKHDKKGHSLSPKEMGMIPDHKKEVHKKEHHKKSRARGK